MAVSQDEFLHATFDKTVTLGTQEVNLKGKFLFCWPYAWEENTNWDIIHQVTQSVTNWVQTRFSQANVESQHIESSVLFAFYNSPSAWRQLSSEDPSVYAKLILYSKVMHLLFHIDDTTEAEVGEDHHGTYIMSIGRTINNILQYQFDTIDDLKKDELYLKIAQISEPAGMFMELLHDCAIDLKIHFGVTQDLGKYFARTAAYCYVMQTWCGDKDLLHLLNPYTQYHMRVHTGGVRSIYEMVFLLERIYIPKSVRENPFWIRCLEVAGFLSVRSNDIIGVEKEWRQKERTGKRVDNVIFHYMEATNCTFEEAVSRGLRKHNFALKEFYDFFEFFKSNQDCLYELSEEEKQIFMESTFIMSECVACNIQGQVLMRRYNSHLEFNFERSSITMH
ncbi:unnamed protein product [Allacma fusca]|uniref:Terpene synthase n=1 Tax=Allacma fusca TaxID=39272 RepID=A0A8J2P8V8_9HEXA|nr:unnamed protein product [Allacma fusca]